MIRGNHKLISIIGLLCLGVVIMTTGALCDSAEGMPKAIKLEYWRAVDSSDDFAEIIAAFKAQYPYVSINVTNFQYEEYEDALTNAWLQGEGPDIYSVPNDWVGKYKEYATPMPAYVNTVTVNITERLGKKEIYQNKQKLKTLSLQELQNQYVDVVYDDVVFPDKEEKTEDVIYGLPLSVDTLALYYNKDILNQAQIINPPRAWDEFVDQVLSTTAINVDGQIVRAGAALGGTENIPRYTDIVSLLMMQNGARMANKTGSVNFTHASETQSGYFPGIKAVEFYTSFTDEGKETYTWNEDMPDALEQFTQGNLAFFIGYNYHLKEIRQQAPGLNFDFTTIPQVNPTQKVNYGYYWVEMVSHNTENSEMAWHFIEYLTSKEQAEKYLTLTEKPAALKSVL